MYLKTNFFNTSRLPNLNCFYSSIISTITALSSPNRTDTMSTPSPHWFAITVSDLCGPCSSPYSFRSCDYCNRNPNPRPNRASTVSERVETSLNDWSQARFRKGRAFGPCTECVAWCWVSDAFGDWPVVLRCPLVDIIGVERLEAFLRETLGGVVPVFYKRKYYYFLPQPIWIWWSTLNVTSTNLNDNTYISHLFLLLLGRGGKGSWGLLNLGISLRIDPVFVRYGGGPISNLLLSISPAKLNSSSANSSSLWPPCRSMSVSASLNSS